MPIRVRVSFTLRKESCVGNSTSTPTPLKISVSMIYIHLLIIIVSGNGIIPYQIIYNNHNLATFINFIMDSLELFFIQYFKILFSNRSVALIYFLDLDQHTAQGTSLALMLPPIGIMAAMQYHSEEHVEWTYSAIIAVTFILGAWLGSKWSLKLPTSMVRLVFSGILFYAAIGMAVKAFRDIFPGNGT